MAKNRSRAYINLMGFAIMGAIGIIMTTGQSLFGFISREYGWGSEGIGVFLSIVSGGLLVSSLIGGELSHRFGKKKVLVCFSMISAGGMILNALSSTVVSSIIGLFLLGFGFGVMESQISGAMADVNSENVNRVLNFSNVCLSLGALTAPLLIVAFLNNGGNWRAVYIATGLLYVAIGVMLLFIDIKKASEGQVPLPAHEGVETDAQGRGLVTFKLLKNPQFLLLLTMMMLYVGAESATSWTKELFSNTQTGQLYSSAALSLFWGVTAVSRSVNAVFGHGKRRQPLLLFFIGIGIAGMIGIVFLKSDIARLICYGIAGFGCGPVWPSLFAVGMERDRRYTGVAGSIMLLAGGTGGTVMPLLLGGVSIWFGIRGVFTFSAMVLGVIMILNILYSRWVGNAVKTEK